MDEENDVSSENQDAADVEGEEDATYPTTNKQ